MTVSQTSSSTPAAAAPDYRGMKLSSVCSLLARPVVITGLFREVLARHFQEGRIETPDLADLVWRRDQTTGIVIENIHRWRPQTTNQRPAVVIKRNAYRNQRRGIGDKHQGNPTDREGNPHFSTYWVGSHTLFCLGGSGAQVELLATEVQRELTEFGPLLQKTLNLFRFAVLEVGPVNELEEATETFVVPVTAGYAFEENWKLLEQAPKLSRVALSTLLDC